MSNIPEYSVSELSYLIKKKLENEFNYIQIRGEISDLKLWNGHFLFYLKDNDGILAARIWKNRVPFLNFEPEEGLEVTAIGKISTHVKRSNYNLIIENINAVSEGELLKLIEVRKKKLKENGYPNTGIKDRGFMDSLYFREPLGLLIEIASYKFEPPFGFSHGQVLEKAHEIRVKRGAVNIQDEDISNALIDLISKK